MLALAFDDSQVAQLWLDSHWFAFFGKQMHGHNHCESVICTLYLCYDMTMQLIVACVNYIVAYEFAQ